MCNPIRLDRVVFGALLALCVDVLPATVAAGSSDASPPPPPATRADIDLMVANLERLTSQLKGDQVAQELSRLNTQVADIQKRLDGSKDRGISWAEVALVILLALVAAGWHLLTMRLQKEQRQSAAASERNKLVFEHLARLPGGAASLPQLRDAVNNLVRDVATVADILNKP